MTAFLPTAHCRPPPTTIQAAKDKDHAVAEGDSRTNAKGVAAQTARCARKRIGRFYYRQTRSPNAFDSSDNQEVPLITATTSTTACCAARANFDANRTALQSSQPPLAEAVESIGLEWLFGRDGALTGRDENRRWLAGTSLPRRVANAQLKTFTPTGNVSCFLAPAHAAAIAESLNRMADESAVIAIIPTYAELSTLLHCHDFSHDIARHRLWFVAGANWSTQLTELFAQHPGLSLPTQFIKLNSLEQSVADALIHEAQRVLSKTVQSRAAHAASLKSKWRAASTIEQLAVVAPSRFRLWNDWGHELRHLFADDAAAQLIDTDDPRATASVSLLAAATKCDALIAPNLSRMDAPGLLPDEMAWVTWCVNGRIPAWNKSHPRDRLLVVDSIDRDRALAAGWPSGFVQAARTETVLEASASRAGVLTMICDTTSLDAPPCIAEFSSQQPMWEFISDDITSAPLAIVDADLGEYVRTCAQRFGVPMETVDLAIFIDRLIVPAYQKGLVTLLGNAGVRVDVFGDGWRDESYASTIQVHGAITGREHFLAAASRASALIQPLPTKRHGAAAAITRPVVYPDRNLSTFLANAKRPARHYHAETCLLTPALIRELLR